MGNPRNLITLLLTTSQYLMNAWWCRFLLTTCGEQDCFFPRFFLSYLVPADSCNALGIGAMCAVCNCIKKEIAAIYTPGYTWINIYIYIWYHIYDISYIYIIIYIHFKCSFVFRDLHLSRDGGPISLKRFSCFFEVLLHCCCFFPCYVNNGAVSRFLLLNLILRIFLHVIFFDEWWWFSIFQVFPNDLSILLIMVLFNCSFASQGLASCWLWRALMFGLLYKDFILLFEGLLHFSFFPCSFNKGVISRFLLLHLFCACFCYTLFCESGSWSRNKECILFFFRRPLNDFQSYRLWWHES